MSDPQSVKIFSFLAFFINNLTNQEEKKIETKKIMNTKANYEFIKKKN